MVIYHYTLLNDINAGLGFYLFFLLFRLQYFELEGEALTQQTLMDRITKHYMQEVNYNYRTHSHQFKDGITYHWHCRV